VGIGFLLSFFENIKLTRGTKEKQFTDFRQFFIVLNYQANVRICPAKLARRATARFRQGEQGMEGRKLQRR
jgi:hypothetical protein